MQFGGYDTQYFLNPSATVTYVTLNADSTIYWNVNIQAVRVGSADLLPDGVTPSSWSFSGTLPVACMDSGASNLLVPPSFYPTLLTAITSGAGFVP